MTDTAGGSSWILPSTVALLVSSVSTSPVKVSWVALTVAIVSVVLLLAVPLMTIFCPGLKPISQFQLPELRVMVSEALSTRWKTRSLTVVMTVNSR